MRSGAIRLIAGMLIGAALMNARPAVSQNAPADYPSRNVQFLIGNPPGGTFGVFARLLADGLQARIGKPVIVENRPGASGVIAVTAVKNAQPDGHFLMFGQFSNAILAPLVRRPRPYETPKDFAPVALIMSYPLALAVHASVPVKSLSEFVAYTKANPGKLNVGTVGVGSWGHIAIELFMDRMGLDMVRVPYTGMTPAVQALVAGDIQVLLAENNVLGTHVESGKVRALAHFGAKDSPRLPNVEPIGPLLPELEQDFWFSVLAPAGTPPEIVRFLNREINAVMNDPAVQARAAAAYMRTYNTTPEVLATMIANEWERWGRVIREKNLELK